MLLPACPETAAWPRTARLVEKARETILEVAILRLKENQLFPEYENSA